MRKPFLKWAGGKSRLFQEISAHFPKKFSRYLEPFVGAGSILLNVNCTYCIANDNNSDLINCYEKIREPGFIEECKKWFSGYNNRESYLELRKTFNETDDKFLKATLFVYLNRHCFNGLCRFNSKKKFNVPYGKYKDVYFPEEELRTWLEVTKGYQFYCKDFREIFGMVREGDCVYADPPYLPLSATSSFANYSGDGFGLKDHIDLAEAAYCAAQRGATVIVSNHHNWYTRELYKQMFGAKLTVLDVARMINSNGEDRKPVEEVIAVFVHV